MSTIVNCPECDQPVSLPSNAPPQARARCPLCAAEYPVEDALKGLPPALVLLDVPAAAPFEPSPEEAAGESGEELSLEGSLEELSLEGPGELPLEQPSEETFAGSAEEFFEPSSEAPSPEESADETPAEPTALMWSAGDKNPDAPTEEGPRFDSWMPASEGEGYELDDGRGEAEGDEAAGSDDDGALIFEGGGGAVALEDAPTMSDLPTATRPRKRRRPSFLGQMIGVIGGGVIGLGLGYFLLLWIGGPKKDFLKVGHKLPAFMVPAEFHPDGADQASVAPTQTETTQVELPDRPPRDEFAANEGGSSFADLQDKFSGMNGQSGMNGKKNGGPATSVTADSDIQAPAGAESPAAEPDMKEQSFAASEAPAADPFASDSPFGASAKPLASAEPALPAFEPKLLSAEELLGGVEPMPEPEMKPEPSEPAPPSEPAKPNEPLEPVEADAPSPPEPTEPVEASAVRVEVASAPTYTAEQLAAALGAVEKNQPKLLAGKLSDPATKRDVVAAFKAYCALGETVTFAVPPSNEAQLQTIRKLAGEVAHSKQALQDFGKIGNVWLSSNQRTKPGVILAGKVLAMKQQGAAHVLWMTPHGHDETRVKVVTAARPAMQPGGAAVVLGSILDGQAVAGYEVTTGNQFAGEEAGAFQVVFSRLIVPAGSN